MESLLDKVHLLRPEWLWALIPAVLCFLILAKGEVAAKQDNWTKYVDAHLLKYLSVQGKESKVSRWTPVIVLLTLILLILAIAGPSWESTQKPAWQGGEPIVAVLSLAQSMNSDDIAPSRLRRASHKLKDMLQQTTGDEHGLVIYSDTPFIAAPLTSDPKVIEQMIPELSTSLMPVLGNRLDLAINEATGLLSRANATRGTVLILTDSIGQLPSATIEAANAAKDAGYTISVLAVGTKQGAKVQTASGQTIVDREGNASISQVNPDRLGSLAKAGGGRFAMLTADNSDLKQLLPSSRNNPFSASSKAEQFQSDSWVDMGYWLLVLPTIFCAFAFRRGWLFLVLITSQSMLFLPNRAMAADDLSQLQTSTAVSSGLWKSKNQAAQENFNLKLYQQAADQFEDPAWKAASLYKSAEYAKAVSEYNNLGQEYNLANSLARAGDLQAALEAYNHLLQQEPQNEDARFNRDLVQDLIQQQEKQQQQKQQQKDSQQKERQQKDKQDQSSSNQAEKDKQQADNAEQQPSQQQNSQKKPESGQNEKQQKRGSSESGEPKDEASSDAQPQSKKPSSANLADESQSHQQPPQHSVSKNQKDERNNEPSPPDNNLLSDLVSEALKGNGTKPPSNPMSAPSPAQPEKIDQAIEQELRKVPDDPSGLLRARIRQHYARLRAVKSE
ncbi:VWA domain-containing protein [Vibrio sp. 99-8-1]|uniref:VWA domain-containing protein n=1 Tax=Vibrio sp. 99-8-1 TaxID=2607602 RepID=UPI001493A2F3|nr:VWA domain-containing protein [Vibrio sp. 99-8-1]NOI67347.1 VWA domain-containing protein [Vibrio sp. 99-8-1]